MYYVGQYRHELCGAGGRSRELALLRPLVFTYYIFGRNRGEC